jgi:hypothetical protein
MAYTNQINYWPTPNATQNIYGENWVAQSFIPSFNYSIGEIGFRAYRVGSPGVTCNVEIRTANEDGTPTSNVLTSGSFNGNNITQSTGGEEVLCEVTPYSLTSGVKYAIVISAPNGNSTNRIVWKTKSPGDYADGILSTSSNSGSNWSGTSQDGPFKVYSLPNVLLSGSSVGTSNLLGSLEIKTAIIIQGNLAGELVLSGELTISSVFLLSGAISGQSVLYGTIVQRFWIDNRPNNYDPDKVYDEETSSWVDKDGRGGSRFQNRVIVINDIGEIFVS